MGNCLKKASHLGRTSLGCWEYETRLNLSVLILQIHRSGFGKAANEFATWNQGGTFGRKAERLFGPVKGTRPATAVSGVQGFQTPMDRLIYDCDSPQYK